MKPYKSSRKWEPIVLTMLSEKILGFRGKETENTLRGQMAGCIIKFPSEDMRIKLLAGRNCSALIQLEIHIGWRFKMKILLIIIYFLAVHQEKPVIYSARTEGLKREQEHRHATNLSQLNWHVFSHSKSNLTRYQLA